MKLAETMQAAMLDAAGAPFRIAPVPRPNPNRGRCWSGSPQAASIRSTSRSALARPRMRASRCPRSSASISPAWSRRSATA